jgi:hypothetical protein
MTGPFVAPCPRYASSRYELASRISPGPFFWFGTLALLVSKFQRLSWGFASKKFRHCRDSFDVSLFCWLFYLRYEQHPACLRHFSQTEWLQGVFLRSGNISAIPSLPSFQLVLILSESRNGWLCKMWISGLQIHVVFRCQIFLDLLF